ncbi:hypothetical protein [Acaryochloris marina]|uniref:hypothetical protein n=1 Tax=Acaryochloris marina TaxID=155978 RepID=UPI0021C3F7AB|nr:hypothetical protein [Acaryochloris marina]BDM81361.1 hypothetical protein AM10699_42280 [Acaryochloris marina MBIC10699]
MFKRLPVIQTLFSTLAVSMVLTSSALATKPTLIAEEESFNPIAPKSESAPVENSDVVEPRRRPFFDNGYQRVIDQTVQMVTNPKAQRLAKRFGLNILNVTWEDTGRYKNSSVGPNISDMTIQVQHRDPKTRSNRLHLMPVIRHPNFSDKTADVRLDRFFLKVGNEKGAKLRKVALKDILKDPRRYLHQPNSWTGRQKSLLAPRDTHALVSAQASFLPIPKGGKAEFNPVLFNYQSYADNPAVLTILATREGTSMTVIDNKRDAFSAGQTWGQRLFFNQNGERASLTGQRASDFVSSGQSSSSSASSSKEVEDRGLNMVLLIQVPLKQKRPPMPLFTPEAMEDSAVGASAPTAKAQRSNVEAAVIGHGEVEGPFTEIDNLAIERDPRFPVRVTVQFYKATSNGAVSQADMKHINQQIARVYDDADYVGSLVVEGDTGRPTEYDGSKQEPPTWWQEFWKRHRSNTGQSKEDAWEMLNRLIAQAWSENSDS